MQEKDEIIEGLLKTHLEGLVSHREEVSIIAQELESLRIKVGQEIRQSNKIE